MELQTLVLKKLFALFLFAIQFAIQFATQTILIFLFKISANKQN